MAANAPADVPLKYVEMFVIQTIFMLESFVSQLQLSQGSKCCGWLYCQIRSAMEMSGCQVSDENSMIISSQSFPQACALCANT